MGQDTVSTGMEIKDLKREGRDEATVRKFRRSTVAGVRLTGLRPKVQESGRDPERKESSVDLGCVFSAPSPRLSTSLVRRYFWVCWG